MDNFEVKDHISEDAQHLINASKIVFDLKVDFSGGKYCGLTLDWEYSQGYMNISMPKFVEKILEKIQHSPPFKPQYAPNEWSQPIYSRDPQLSPPTDASPLLIHTETTSI